MLEKVASDSKKAERWLSGSRNSRRRGRHVEIPGRSAATKQFDEIDEGRARAAKPASLQSIIATPQCSPLAGLPGFDF